MVKKGAVLPLALTALLLVDCDYFNAPIQPFIDMNTAVVSLNRVNMGAQAADCVVDYEAGKADYEIPVALNNPQQFNIQAAIKSAVKNGGGGKPMRTLL